MGIRITAALIVAVSSLAACKDDPLPASQQIDVDAPPADVDAPPGVCGAGATVDFLKACDPAANQCGSCECHTFVHENVCDKQCSSDADCPAPSQGCEGQGAGMGFYCRT